MKENKKNDKRWYEKISIFIGIIVGIFSILGIRVFKDGAIIESEINVQSLFNQEDTFVTDLQKDNSQEFTDGDIIFSEEELLIGRNFDLIQELKTKYLYEDTEIIKNDSVEFYIYENAGFHFVDKCEEPNIAEFAGIRINYELIVR